MAIALFLTLEIPTLTAPIYWLHWWSGTEVQQCLPKIWAKFLQTSPLQIEPIASAGLVGWAVPTRSIDRPTPNPEIPRGDQWLLRGILVGEGLWRGWEEEGGSC